MMSRDAVYVLNANLPYMDVPYMDVPYMDDKLGVFL